MDTFRRAATGRVRATASRVPARVAAIAATVALVLAPLAPGNLAAQARWRLVEERRFGSPDAGDVELSDIRGLVVDPRGVVTLLESSQQQLHQFDRDGRLLRSVSRKGSGPGEMKGANGLVRGADGRLWVIDPQNQRRMAFSPDGRYLAQVLTPRMGYAFMADAAVDARGRIVERALVGQAGGGTGNRILRTAPDSDRSDTLRVGECASRRSSGAPKLWRGRWGNTRRTVMDVPYSPRALSVWDPAGALWCTANDEYRLLRIAFGTLDTLARIERSVAPERLSDAERDSAIARAKKALEGAEHDADFDAVPRVRQYFAQLSVDDAGRLWARRSMGDTLAVVFDVYMPDGRALATAAGRGRAPSWAPPPVISGDRVYIVLRDQDDIPFVARYRVAREAP